MNVHDELGKRRRRRFAAEKTMIASVNLVEGSADDSKSETILPVDGIATSVNTDDKTSQSIAAIVSTLPATEIHRQPCESEAEEKIASPRECTTGDTVSERPARCSKHPWLLQLEDVHSLYQTHILCQTQWFWSLRVPLLLLIALAFVPKLIIVWILVVLTKPIFSAVFRRFPETWKNEIRSHVPNPVRNSPTLQELDEGTDQALPFILFWMYLCCAPFTLVWMMVHWIKGFRRPKVKPIRNGENGDAVLVFPQNKKSDSAQSDNNFYHSRAFGLVLIGFFALGIPAFVSLALYEKLGIEHMVERSTAVQIVYKEPAPWQSVRVSILPIGNRAIFERSTTTTTTMHTKFAENSALPPVNKTSSTTFESQPLRRLGHWPWLRMIGVEPTKSTVFFVHFYLVSLASAVCMLFFRAWFTFPLNFLCDEHDVEFTASGIRRRGLKGWFLSVLTMNRWATGGGPDRLSWKEVKSLRHLEEGFTRLCPLPETAFKKESLTYKLLNKAAALIDGLSNRMNTANYLVFSVTERDGDFGRNIKIDLNELNREQRVRLFYAVKNWAPHVTIMKTAEEQLIGSTVLQDVRYTQLWFDLLTSKTRAKRKNQLTAGERLNGNEFTIEERISSGGQATTYLARRPSGSKCVLKEFILATSSSPGALIESAREFEAEVSLLSQLNHPEIVKLEEFFSEDGRVYVVMEYVQGQSLRQKVDQVGALSESEVVRLSQSVCNVLEYLHTCTPPIVHRDITPENIIIQPDGTIKLIDFSLAVRQDSRQTTDSCAKQAFTPPEQFREEACAQSDIYALGATMSFLLTASNPKPISKSSPRAKALHVTPALNSIVEQATELDLNQRYESVRWLKLDLDRISGQADC